jgi:transketolase
MRTAFIEQLIVEARKNPRIFLVVGDLGYSVVEPFAAEFPDRFLNAGVAEQNMTGLAAGLASEGFHVFTYSIGNFPTLRCLEQIRNDVCYHQLPVTIVAVGAGMAYGNLGYSHHCVQDIACLRGLPRMTILSPADPGETRHCVSWLCQHAEPSYLRLGKAGEKILHSLAANFHGPLQIVDNAADVAIVGTGSILSEAINAATMLADRGIAADVFSMVRLTSLQAQDFSKLGRYQQILTIEEHVGPGGLGELLRSLLPRQEHLPSAYVKESATSLTGSLEWLRRNNGLDAATLCTTVLNRRVDRHG